MKIVICGAGLVGGAIASHLSEERNDVTVIDASQENIGITDQVDVHGLSALPRILTGWPRPASAMLICSLQ